MLSKSFYIALCKEEDHIRTLKKQIDDTWDSIQTLKKQYETHDLKTTRRVVNELLHNESEDFPDTYHRNLTWRQKTYLVVKTESLGDTTTLAKAMHKMDPEISEEKAKYIVTQHASKLYRDGLIGARKKNGKYEYFFRRNEMRVSA